MTISGRSFGRLSLALGVLLAAIDAVGFAAPQSAPPLNIVVIVSDDHRNDLLSCAGHPIVRTPQLDRLAERGVRFENAFVTTSICAASRATILCGVVERSHRFTFGTPPLAEEWVSAAYPTRLREHGYTTAFFGKFGISVAGGRTAIARMFHEFEDLTRTPYFKTLPDGGERHVDDLIGDRAVEFAGRAAEPFCLSLSFNGGHAEDGDLENHYPCAPPERDLYADQAMPPPPLADPEVFLELPEFLRRSMNRERWYWRWDTPEKYDRNLRAYFRLLSTVDRNVGRVWDSLQARGIAGRTAVIFLGDNGYYLGERGLAGKWSHFEQSLRVPMIVFDPRAAAESRGRVLPQMALNIDVAATVLEWAAAEENGNPQGRSLVPLVRGLPVSDAREGFFCEHRMDHPAIPRWEGYRGARYVYARYDGEQPPFEFLHDLASDPDQRINLASDPAAADVLATLRAQCDHERDRFACWPAGRLPRVLLLGDSISQGYHAHVVAALAGQAQVFRPQENCAGTTLGLQHIDRWLKIDGGSFDVIHFNFGLHDLKRVRAPGAAEASDDPAAPRQADLATYRRNLREITQRLQATGATLVFATTTPFPPGVRPHRDPQDAVDYNDAAVEIMRERGVAIDDLYAEAADRLAEWQKPVNVHFTDEGSAFLAERVVRHIRQALIERRAAASPAADGR